MAYGFRMFKIPKGNGKFRMIHVPHPRLKIRLRRLLKVLTGLGIPAGPHIHAYVRRRNIVTNARRLQAWDDVEKTWRTPRFLLKLDIKDFFNSLRKSVVMEACDNTAIPERLCQQIVQHCFVKIGTKWVLPQGSPTSPLLSNLVMIQITRRLNGIIRKINKNALYPIRFSAYCDNLTFTCDSNRVAGVIRPVEFVLGEYGLKINRKKIEFHASPARKIVCGVQLNDSGLAAPKKYWRTLRAEIANATIDRQSGLADKGFRLTRNSRNDIRSTFTKSPGIVRNFLPGVSAILDAEPVPVEEWRGKIAYIASIDPRRAAQLTAMVNKWESL